MTFMLSQRSLGRLDGVKNELHSVVCKAIKISKVDFGVICGMRTHEEQKALYDSGASQTLKSKHLGDAVDLMAYLNGRHHGNFVLMTCWHERSSYSRGR